MGMEDREWYREELRQKGKRPSWDNFNAGKAQPHPSEAPVAEGEITRIPRPIKTTKPPSYVHLQAQEILDARAEAQRGSRWPMLLLSFFAISALGYAAYLLLR